MKNHHVTQLYVHPSEVKTEQQKTDLRKNLHELPVAADRRLAALVSLGAR